MSHPTAPVRTVAVIGGGPAGLMAAEVLAGAGCSVTVFDRMPSVGRKFLMAGRGGLNLTHGEPFERVVSRFGEAGPSLRPALEAFPPQAIRAWAAGLGQDTFVGSSGRVFPRAWKASPLLRAWLGRLASLGVGIRTRHRWIGFDGAGRPLLVGPESPPEPVPASATLLALGGASWPRLGSDGAWTEVLEATGIAVSPLRPSNCGLHVPWSELFRARFAGVPLTRVAIRFGGAVARGDPVITRAGLEGGPVYAVSAAVRAALHREEAPRIALDLRPDLPEARLAENLSRPRLRQSTSTFLRKAAGLSPVAAAVLRDAQEGPLPAEPGALAARIKQVLLPVTGTDGIARAISSTGGVRRDEVDDRFMLRRRPGVFVAGEMADWDAPTGGYLLSACLATGAAAGRGILDWLGGR